MLETVMQSKDNQRKLSNFQVAKLVVEANEQLGFDIDDPEALVKKIESLERGLPAESEFIALVSWLGKCKMVHKLSQEQYPPISRDSYQVPDLFAVFEYQDHSVPTLIEVKSTSKKLLRKLSWKPDYLERLRQYADLLNLPLLIAWKHRIQEMNLSFWTLFDANAFQKPSKNYQMQFERAMNENLLGVLAGDFAVDIRAGVGISFEVFPLGDKAQWQKAYHNKTEFFGKIHVFRTDGEENRIETDDSRLSSGLLAILECAPFLSEYYDYITDSSINFGWKVPHNQFVFAHQMFQILLTSNIPAEGEIIWSNVLRRADFPVSSDEILRTAEMSRNICDSVFHQIPNTHPAFLS
jgi:hypothetical protein